MKCPKCGHENPAEAELCEKCRSVRFVSAGGKKPPAKSKASPQQHYLASAGAKPLVLTPGKVFTIGRATECSFAIPSKRVSRVHCEIAWEGESPVVRDKASANGVSVNGKRVQEAKLEPGDELEIGPFLCVYRFGDPAKPDTSDGSQTFMADKGDLLSGSIGESGLVEVLQGLEFNTKTGTLSVFARGFSGWMTLSTGVPCVAEADDKRDDEAVFAMLGLARGRFAFVPELRTEEKRMKTTVTALLLEWGRRQDERR